MKILLGMLIGTIHVGICIGFFSRGLARGHGCDVLYRKLNRTSLSQVVFPLVSTWNWEPPIPRKIVNSNVEELATNLFSRLAFYAIFGFKGI
jgi:hypothetical protein